MGMMKRKMMDMFGGKFKNLLLKNFFKKSWGKHRILPQVAEKSFSKQWQEKQKGEGI
jgi:L-lactate dehydrogenase complex protein LldF